MDFLGIGAPEIILVLLLAFVIFGPLRIVEMSREAGRMLRDLSKNAGAVQRQLEDELTLQKPVKKRGADKASSPD